MDGCFAKVGQIQGLVPELGFYFKKPLGDKPFLTFEDQSAGLQHLEESCNRILSHPPSSLSPVQ